MLSFHSPAQAREPELVAASFAPNGMEIIPEAVKLRLRNPVIKFELYCATGKPSVIAPGRTFVGYVWQTTRIRPSSTSFTDIFGVRWYNMTTTAGSPGELILAEEVNEMLAQPGVPPADKVNMGRWAITELRLVSPRPNDEGDFVKYAFDLQCYVPSGSSTGGGMLTLFHSSLIMTFPMRGVPMQSVSPRGYLEPESVISPVDFDYDFSEPAPGEQLETYGPRDVMLDIRPFIWGRNSTFDLTGWSLDPPSTIPARVAVLNAWNRAFSNVTRYVYDDYTRARPLGFRRSAATGLFGAYAPFFIVNCPYSGTDCTTAPGSMENWLQQVATQAPQESPWPFDEDLILHAAPSPETSGAILCYPVRMDEAFAIENQSPCKLKLRMDYGAPADLRVRIFVKSGSAQPVSDYIFPDQVVEIPAGKTVWEVPLPLVNNNTAESTESLRFGLEIESGLACVVEEEAGVTIYDDDSTPAFVGPVILEEPEDQTGAGGGSVTFQVRAAGTGLSYQWYKGGAALSGRTTASLALTSLTTTSAGRYRVKVSNSAGLVMSRYVTLTVTAPAPEITVEQPAGTAVLAGSGTVDFGSVNTGANVTRTFTLRNTGGASLTGISAALTGGTAPDFSITAAPLASVAANASTTFMVRFAPGAAGARSTTLRIQSNDADENPYDILLTGTAVIPTAPEIAVEGPGAQNLVDGSASVPFGTVLTGTNTSLIFTVRNLGSAGLTGVAVTFSGGNPGDFTVTAAPTAAVAAGGGTSFAVRFAPAAAGSRTTTMRVASNDADENPFDITLTGTGQAPAPEIALEQPAGTGLTDGAATVNFGTVLTGTNTLLVFTVRNSGTANLTGVAAIFSGGNTADFTVTAAAAATVTAGSSTTFTVRFAPGGAGARSTTLRVASNDANENPFDIVLTGIGQAPAPEIVLEQPAGTSLTNGGATVNFGTVPTGGNASLSFTVRNTGTASLTGVAVSFFGGNASEFTVTAAPPATVAVSAAATFTVRFTPSALGARTTTMRVASNDADENPLNVSLTGTQAPPLPEIVVEHPPGTNLVSGTATVSFGSIFNGAAGNITFTVRNTGGSALTGVNATFSGGNAADFAVTSAPLATVGAGGTTTMTVRFAPAAAGLRTTVLRVSSSDADENPFLITINGTGVVPLLTLNSYFQEVVAGAGTFQLTVTSNTAWTWSSNQAWLTAPGETAAQSGNQTFSYQVAANSQAAPRTGVITFSTTGLAPVTHTVTQLGTDDHGDTTATATLIAETSTATGNIGVPGDHDYFRINVTAPGLLILESSSDTDLYGYLLDASGLELASDDDAGVGLNFRIAWQVTPGTHYVYVRHYYSNETGSYALRSDLLLPPLITQQPAGAAISAGDSRNLQVTAAGRGLTYQWYVGAAGNTAQPVAGAAGSSLTVSPVNNATYWVQVSNAAGVRNSSAATLTVDTSPAGQAWNGANSGVSSTLWSVEWLGNRFVAVGDGGVILTSPDGTVWTRRTSGTTQQLESVAWSGREFVAAGAGGTIVSSADGATWAARNSGTTTEFNAVTWDGAAFWAAGPAGTVRRSFDGRSWQGITSNILESYNLRHLEGALCAVGPVNLMTSANGTSWTRRLNTSGVFYDDVTSNGLTWLTCGSDGKVRLSTDLGQSWTPGETVSTTWLRGATSDGRGFVVVGNAGTIYTSPQGTAWTVRPSGVSGALLGVAWNGRAYVAVGEGGVILRSTGAWQGAGAAGYAQWAASWGLRGGAARADGDWDRDGVSNEWEYYFGYRPADPTHGAMPLPEAYSANGEDRVRFAFPRAASAAGLGIAVDYSPDALIWSQISQTVSPDGTGYTERLLWSGRREVRGFFRFRFL